MPQKTVKTRQNLVRRVVLLTAVLLLAAGGARGVNLLASASACSSAADCRNKISDLQEQNNDAQDALDSLVSQAGSYEQAISNLQAQIDTLSQTIAANEAKQAEIQDEITAKQAQLEHERQLLGSDLKAMYVDGQMTTIEMLATSKNLSDYVDKEEYRNMVESQIQKTMDQIAELQKQLQQDKSDIDSLLASQRSQEDQVAAARNQQASLLSYNQSQQSQFNAQIGANRAQIQKLQSSQAALNSVGAHAVTVAASGGSGGKCDAGNGNGGYPMPWCNAAQDSVVTSYHPSAGNYTNRECTSFAYWYFTSVEGHTDFSVGYGNAKNWISSSNYPVHDNPAVGSIGVKTVGPYGHVVIVKALPGQTFGGVTVPSGEVLVYEMNYDYSGHFRASLRDIDTFAGFLYQ